MVNSTILVVEDNPTQQYVFRELCERFGYNCLIVSSGEEALGALGVAQYAAVVMDIGLPGMSGIETVRELRVFETGTERHTPVIALTGDIHPERRDECLAAGMDDFMTKPFSIEAFRKILLRWTYDPLRPNLRLINRAPESDQELYG